MNQISNARESGKGKEIAVTSIQKIIASRMLWSKANIPCFYLKEQADITDLGGISQEIRARRRLKISTNDCIICSDGKGCGEISADGGPACR